MSYKDQTGPDRRAQPSFMLKIKELNADNIPQVIELSLKVFNPPDGKNDPYHSLKKWRKYLKKGGILLGAFINHQLVGYLFAYPKNKKTFHCWLTGVEKKFRKRGIFKKLMRALIKKIRKLEYKVLTLNTYPKKFPAMFAYLKKYGFKQYKSEEKKMEGKTNIKMFFQKKDIGYK